MPMNAYCFEGSLFFREGHPVAELRVCSNAIDSVRTLEDGVFEVKRTFSLGEREPVPETLSLEIRTCFTPEFYEIPCVTYNGNHWGSGVEPQGLLGNGHPWVYASHRSSLPGCTYSEDGTDAVCLFGAPENPPFSMSMARTESGMRHILLLPQIEKPVRYCAKAAYDAPLLPKLFLNGTVTLTAYVVLNTAVGRGLAIAKALQFGWRRFGHALSPCFEPDTLWRLGIRFARESVYFEEGDFRGFCMGLYYDAGEWVQRRNNLEIGWVGQNASLAVALIADGLKNGNQATLSQGIGVLDTWQKARLPNGLFRCRFDRVLKNGGRLDNPEERQDAANLFSVVRQYLRAYHLLKEHGIPRPDYRDTALAVCAFGLESQGADGSFAKAWFNDGTPSDTDGTVGAYMAWALLQGYEETTDEAYLKAAERGFAWYWAQFERDGYMTAGALDTYCIDKESAMPMLALAVDLYGYTARREYLDKAEAISYYLETWLYHYTVKAPEGTLLSQYGYDTLGATAVSVQHQHVDAYALQFLRYWVRLARYASEPRWEELAWAVWCNTTQFLSDGTLVIDGVRRPAGSQDEGVCQTFWRTSRGEPFHTSRWLVCWNGAFRLENLMDEDVRAMLHRRGAEKSRRLETIQGI